MYLIVSPLKGYRVNITANEAVYSNTEETKNIPRIPPLNAASFAALSPATIPTGPPTAPPRTAPATGSTMHFSCNHQSDTSVENKWTSTPQHRNECRQHYIIHIFVHKWPSAWNLSHENLFSNSHSHKNIYGKFHQNLFTKDRDIVSHKIGVTRSLAIARDRASAA